MNEANKKRLHIAFWIVAIIAIAFFSDSIGLFQLGNGVLKRYSVTYTDSFDTVTEIIGYCESEKEFEEKAELLHQEMRKYHAYYDIYNTYPEIVNLKSINDMAGKGPVKVDEEIMGLLSYCIEMYGETNGQVNVAMGSLLNLWHTYRQEGIDNPELAAIPTREELAERAGHIDIRSLALDKKQMTVELKDIGMSLDVGSIAKGYAVDRVAEYARELGFENMLISVGGNILAIGNKPDGTKWNIGVMDPFVAKGEKTADSQYIDHVEIENTCVVTSGDYQRYYTVNGVEYCHIIDPDTWMPSNEFSSVTIIGPNSAMADALSTALFNMNLEEGQQLIESLDGWEAMWIDAEGKLHYTDGFHK